MTSQSQPAIQAPLPPLGRFCVFDLVHSNEDPAAALRTLAEGDADPRAVIGLGMPLVARLGASIEGLRVFPSLAGPGCSVPSTQGALWCFLSGDDAGEILMRSRRLESTLDEAFRLAEVVDSFMYAGGRDLTGYVDGTENPTGDAALDASVVRGAGEGLDGSSFVAGQRWLHDLDAFEAHTQRDRDFIIGRTKDTDEELDDAPETAHVKRSAQETFEPEAFMLRRSMPFTAEQEHGLYFVAYVEELGRFERVLRRMAGVDDGIVDALFTFSTPVSGGYYWCPPLADGRLDLTAMGI